MELLVQSLATQVAKHLTPLIRMYVQAKRAMPNACKLCTIRQKSLLMNCWQYSGKHMTPPPLTARELMWEHSTEAEFFITMKSRNKRPKNIKLNSIKVVLLTDLL